MITPPNLIRRACGGWMAVSPQGETIKFCVLGDTEGEAREAFRASLACWRANLDTALVTASTHSTDATPEQRQPQPSP